MFRQLLKMGPVQQQLLLGTCHLRQVGMCQFEPGQPDMPLCKRMVIVLPWDKIAGNDQDG